MNRFEFVCEVFGVLQIIVSIQYALQFPSITCAWTLIDGAYVHTYIARAVKYV